MSVMPMVMPKPNHWAVSSLMPQALPSSVKPEVRLTFPSVASDKVLSMAMAVPRAPAAMRSGLPVSAPTAMVATDAMAPTTTPIT